jgi:hypothetical protein
MGGAPLSVWRVRPRRRAGVRQQRSAGTHRGVPIERSLPHSASAWYRASYRKPHYGAASHPQRWPSTAPGAAQAKAERSCGDYGFHMAVTSWSPRVSEDMATLVKEGINSFKFFMAYKVRRGVRARGLQPGPWGLGRRAEAWALGFRAPCRGLIWGSTPHPGHRGFEIRAAALAWGSRALHHSLGLGARQQRLQAQKVQGVDEEGCHGLRGLSRRAGPRFRVQG